MRYVEIELDGKTVEGILLCAPSSENGLCAVRVGERVLCRYFEKVKPLDDEAREALQARRNPRTK